MNKKNKVDKQHFADIFSIPVNVKKRKVITRFSKLQAKAKDKGILLEKCSKYYELWVLGVTAHCSNLNKLISYCVFFIRSFCASILTLAASLHN